jgi:hypothetical protein
LFLEVACTHPLSYEPVYIKAYSLSKLIRATGRLKAANVTLLIPPTTLRLILKKKSGREAHEKIVVLLFKPWF